MEIDFSFFLYRFILTRETVKVEGEESERIFWFERWKKVGENGLFVKWKVLVFLRIVKLIWVDVIFMCIL